MSSATSSRRKGRYIGLLVLLALGAGGWSGFWYYAADKAQQLLDGWRAREARAGRVYDCGAETFGGYPFRFEFACDRANAVFRSLQPPVEIKLARILAALQVYQPNLIISEFEGPATIGETGKPATLRAKWTLAQSSVRGTPAAPERADMVFDDPVLEQIDGAAPTVLLRAKHIELHGRVTEGAAADKRVIEAALSMESVTAPSLHPAAAQPLDTDVVAVLHGLRDFTPKPWATRFREIQAANGHIDVSRARIQQGDVLAVAGGKLSLNAQGRLQGQLSVTIAGLDAFLDKIGAQQMVQNSPAMDRFAGMLDRFSPGLGSSVREKASANIAAGVNMIGQKTTLEGRQAVSLPMRFDDGAIFLGPIPLGHAPALF